MANSWHEADLGKVFPGPLRKLIEDIGKLQDQVTTALAVVQQALNIASTVAGLASQDPIEAIIREALALIEQLIDGLVEGTTAHAIMIPIQKQYFGLGDPIPPGSEDPTAITPKFDQLAVSNSGYAQNVVKDITPDTISFVNNAESAVGGNLGYWKTLVSSLNDPGDYARPTFPDNFAVTGVCVIFGSESLTDLYRIVALINKFIHLGLRADMLARSQPHPEGLRVRTVAIPTQGRIGVQLDWTPVPLFLINPLFSLEKSLIKEIFVIRSTSPMLREAFAWGNFFATEPSDAMSDLPVSPDGATKVIARLTNDGFLARYIDDDTSLELNKSYYYVIALRYTIGDTVQPISEFSNAVRAFYNRRPGTTRFSEPPDWFATPSLVQMFPAIQSAVSIAKLFIEGALSRTASNNGIANMLKQTVAQIQLLLDQANLINQDLQRLRELSNALANAKGGGIYTTTFNVKEGGIGAWTSKLATKLSDRTDPTRPPFDGQELTAGFVLVAGAPNILGLLAFEKMIELLFGSGSDNPFKDALDSLGSTAAPDYFTDFDGSMSAIKRTPDEQAAAVTAAKPKPVFDAKMQPSETLPDC